LQTAWGAFTLREETYAGMRDDAQRIKRALILVVVVGLIVGVTGAVGRLTDWAFSPPMDKMQGVVLAHLMKMPWYADVSRSPQALAQFQQWYNVGWQIARAVAPSPTALLGVVTTPLSLLVVWLVYGLLAHLAARTLGGRGSVGQTLGYAGGHAATAWRTRLPAATAAGVARGRWCALVAIRAAHGSTCALVATLRRWLGTGRCLSLVSLAVADGIMEVAMIGEQVLARGVLTFESATAA
jgi:hypothetical protein